MIFRFVQERVNQNGSSERLVTDFARSELILGRGGDAHLILPSKKVSLIHAKLTWEQGGLVISDLGSLTGVRVNGRRVAQATIKSGDSIELGDLSIRAEVGSDIVELIVKIPMSQVDADDESLAQRVSKLSIEHHLPSMRTIVGAVVVIGMLGLLVYPLVLSSFGFWNSGPISNAHKLIEADCQKCHAQPFQRVQDRECLTCHALTEHSKELASFTKAHPQLEMRCAQCHMEHNGDGHVISKDSDFCVGCHADMRKLYDKASVLDVRDFKSHPEFRISALESSGAVVRVSLDDKEKAVDRAQIKLNHEIHLKPGLRGKDGPVTLECNSCHQLDTDFKKLKPIAFDSHCRDCHSLGFDERLPSSEVPHGDEEAVYPALFTEYTKLLLLKEDGSIKSDSQDRVRTMPSAAASSLTGLQTASVGMVATSAREAEKQLFTRTGCFLCHSVTEKSGQDQTDTNSHYRVRKPEIPAVWFPAARFSHGAHEEFACESCHDKTRNSSKTSDVLLPGKKLCQECHADGDKVGHVRSGCAECHSYHDAIGIPHEKKQNIADYLHGLTR